MNLDQARAERDAGMAQALEHAERVEPSFAVVAFDALVDFAERNRTFTSYDFRMDYHKRGLPAPPTDKAFGGIFQRAAREHVIVRIGYDQHPERHCSPTPLWMSKVMP